MKRLSLSTCAFVVMLFFDLPIACPAGQADDFIELSNPSIGNQESFQLARLGSRRFVRRGVPAKTTFQSRGLRRKNFAQKSFNLFQSRRINDLRHIKPTRPVLRDWNLRAATLKSPGKDFINLKKGILRRSRDVKRSINAQQRAVMKQFDTERLRR